MVRNKKHILMICPFSSPNVGGVETHLDKLIKELGLTKKYYVTLITYQPLTTNSYGKTFEIGDGYEIHRINWFGMDLFPKLEQYFPLQFLYLFPGLFLKSVIYFIKHYKYIDIIHAHGLVAASIAVILNTIKKKRIILSTHAIYDFKRRSLLRFFVKILLSFFDYILAVSRIAQEELLNMGFPGLKLGAFKNWIDTDSFKPQKINDIRLPNNRNAMNVLFVGRFIPQKGIRILLNSARKLEDINFHFVGTGPLLEDIINASKFSPNIIYHGILMQNSKSQFKELVSLYSACDHLISPYLYDEGYSTTLIESISCGTPVIVSDRGSPPAFLTRDVANLLPHTPNANDIVKMLSSLKNIDELDKIRTRKLCRNYAIKNFSRKNVQIIINAYEGN